MSTCERCDGTGWREDLGTGRYRRCECERGQRLLEAERVRLQARRQTRTRQRARVARRRL